MIEYKKQTFPEERALFQAKDVTASSCTFIEGESPFKESEHIRLRKCDFESRYPIWYAKNVRVKDTHFEVGSRAGFWYTDNLFMQNSLLESPKNIRFCKKVELVDVEFKGGEETLWWCKKVTLRNVKAEGSYFALQSQNMDIDGLTLSGKYAFDGVKNVHIRNSTLITKDIFWNSENVVAEDCEIRGEYFGWNSKNVTLIRCKITSHQGFCYMKNVTLIDCEVTDSDLTFEYCENIDARIKSRLLSVKNPTSGIIRCQGIDELIQDDCDPSKTIIETDYQL